MNCQTAHELILETLDSRFDAEEDSSLQAHLAQCEMCRSFWEAQRAVDAALAAHIVAPLLSAAFKSNLERKIGAERKQALQAWVPDLLHIGGGILATAACFFWMSVSPAVVITAGIALTLVSYAVQTMLRFWLENLEGL